MKPMKTRKTGTTAGAMPPATALPAPQPHELIECPSREELIRRRAFELYERNGRVDGHALDDWLTAEAEVAHLVVDAAARSGSAVEHA